MLVYKKLKTTQQCALPAQEANNILGFIQNTVPIRVRERILCLYSTLVRPHLEHCIQRWDPLYRKDMGLSPVIPPE